MGNTVSCFDRYGRRPAGPLLQRRAITGAPPQPKPEEEVRHRMRRPSIASLGASSSGPPSPGSSEEDEQEEQEEDTQVIYAEQLQALRTRLTKRVKLSKGVGPVIPSTVTITLSSDGKAIKWSAEGKRHKPADSFPVAAVYRTQISPKNPAQLEVIVDRADRKSVV